MGTILPRAFNLEGIMAQELGTTNYL